MKPTEGDKQAAKELTEMMEVTGFGLEDIVKAHQRYRLLQISRDGTFQVYYDTMVIGTFIASEDVTLSDLLKQGGDLELLFVPIWPMLQDTASQIKTFTAKCDDYFFLRLALAAMDIFEPVRDRPGWKTYLSGPSMFPSMELSMKVSHFEKILEQVEKEEWSDGDV